MELNQSSSPAAAVKEASGRLWRSGLPACGAAALLARRLEAVGVSHLHAHFGTNPATVARLVARMAPVTYSFTAHGPDEFDDPRGLDLPGKIAEAAFVGDDAAARWNGDDT